jgi:hypothetical protein
LDDDVSAACLASRTMGAEAEVEADADTDGAIGDLTEIQLALYLRKDYVRGRTNRLTGRYI